MAGMMHVSHSYKLQLQCVKIHQIQAVTLSLQWYVVSAMVGEGHSPIVVKASAPNFSMKMSHNLSIVVLFKKILIIMLITWKGSLSCWTPLCSGFSLKRKVRSVDWRTLPMLRVKRLPS